MIKLRDHCVLLRGRVLMHRIVLRLNSAAGGRTRQRLDVAGGRGDVAGAGGRGRAGGDATCAEARERTRTRTAGDMLLRLACPQAGSGLRPSPTTWLKSRLTWWRENVYSAVELMISELRSS